jgi:hypothetical protein
MGFSGIAAWYGRVAEKVLATVAAAATVSEHL